MLPTEIGILQSIGLSVVNPITYISLSLFLAVILYIVIGIMWDIPHSYKLTLSLIIPITLLEIILTLIFSPFGVQLDWGKYVYQFPIFGDFEITHGVQISKFLGFVFDFGLVKNIGLPYLDSFVKTIPSLPEPNIFFKGFVFVYTNIDTVIDFIFFYYLFKALMAITTDIKDKNVAIVISVALGGIIGYIMFTMISASLMWTTIVFGIVFIIMYCILTVPDNETSLYAGGLAVIPVALYSYFVSNGITEYGKVLPELQKIFYFLSNGDTFSRLMFFGTLIISFILVEEILTMVIDLIYKGGSSTIKPQWVVKEWQQNSRGVAFLYTSAYAVMYALHSYSWYIFFPGLVFYTLFKQVSGGAIEMANEHSEKVETRKMIHDIINEPKGVSRMERGKEEKDYSWVFLLIVIGGVVVLLWKMGFLPMKLPF